MGECIEYALRDRVQVWSSCLELYKSRGPRRSRVALGEARVTKVADVVSCVFYKLKLRLSKPYVHGLSGALGMFFTQRDVRTRISSSLIVLKSSMKLNSLLRAESDVTQ